MWVKNSIKMDVYVYGVLDGVWYIVYKFLIIKDVFLN